VVALLGLLRRRNRPRPGEEEEGAEGEDEAVAVVGLLATRKARAPLKEPAKRLGRMARTRRPRLIRRSGSEACLHETVSDFLLPSLQAPECPRVESLFAPQILSVRPDDSTLTASLFPVLPVKHMMYGFGDVQEPDKETVDLVEDMTLDYVTNFAHRCMEVSARRGKLQTEDLLYLIRNDEKKVQRVNELLDMNMQLKEARKNFSTDEAGIDPAK
jgi:transcription initiation factor TFIID subunit 13